MPLDGQHWKAISPSQFPWEEEALAWLRRILDRPWALRGWSNFEVVDGQGRRYEIDALVLTVHGLFLVEIKSYSGQVLADPYQLIRRQGQGAPFVETNPLSLTNHKCRVLRSALGRNIPRLEAVLFLSHPEVHLTVKPGIPQHIYTRNTLPAFLRSAGRPVIDSATEARVVQAMKDSGISTQTRRSVFVGEYVLQTLLGEGPDWQDFLGKHRSMDHVRRVRAFSARLEDREARERAKRAAQREFRLLEWINHDGVLKPIDYKEHELGHCLIYPFYPDAARLDHFLATPELGERQGRAQRLKLWRQLADILRYAHERKLYHRALAPQNVLILSPSTESLRPLIMNWQTARASDQTTGTVHLQDLVEDQTTAYMAPEAMLYPESAAEQADLFSLGCLGYFILSGQPPASTQVELQTRLQEYPGLRLTSVLDGVLPELAELVERCTHPDLSERLDSVPEFLSRLARVEALLAGELEPAAEEIDPARAQPGDPLVGGLLFQKPLGQGGVAVAYQVQRGNETLVLKVALKAESNQLLEDEAEVLARLNDRQVVQLRQTLKVSDRRALLLSFAGPETLAERLRREGPLQLELLSRFGDDLLRLVEVLEKAGVHHRDLKPANLGVLPMGENNELRLVLFDFSLSRVPVDRLEVGTRDYLDPFLSLRRPPRWDLSAERYAAALTLYEMATGVLPRWGDGQTNPAVVACKLVLEEERFPPELRASLGGFFRRALARDASQRFDNAEELRTAFRQALESRQAEDQIGAERTDWSQVAAATPVTELGLSPAGVQALDRVGILRAGDLVALTRARLTRERGLGSRTRRELLAVRDRLLELLGQPEPEVAPGQGLEGLLAFLERAADPGEQALARVFLQPDLHWPTLQELAQALRAGPNELRRQMPRLRRTWQEVEELSPVLDQVAELLAGLGGVAVAEDVVRALLIARGSTSNQPSERQGRARALLRAALELEGLSETPRFFHQRMEGDRHLVAAQNALVPYALRLGEVADQLSSEEPLPSRARVLERLQELAPPERASPLTEASLLRLAAGMARQAALSSRGEFYPVGMEARRALLLSHGALLGTWSLTPAQLAERVKSRYPEARDLPLRPELDRLLADLELDFVWNEESGGYHRRFGGLNLSTTTPSGSRGLLKPTQEPIPQAQLHQRLARLVRERSPLVVTSRSRDLESAQAALVERWAFQPVSVEAALLAALEEVGRERRIPWETLLRTDRAGPDHPDWGRLLQVVRLALARVETELKLRSGPVLLERLSLLARYQPDLKLVEELLACSGQPGCPGPVWVLTAVRSEGELPRVDGRPVPLPVATHPVFLPASWLYEKAEAAPA